MRKQIIAGNWKMNGTIASGSILIEAFTSFLGDKNLDCEVVVCPPFTALERAVSLTRDTQVGVGVFGCTTAALSASISFLSKKPAPIGM